MIFEALFESAERGELILVDGGFCHWHSGRGCICGGISSMVDFKWLEPLALAVAAIALLLALAYCSGGVP